MQKYTAFVLVLLLVSTSTLFAQKTCPVSRCRSVPLQNTVNIPENSGFSAKTAESYQVWGTYETDTEYFKYQNGKFFRLGRLTTCGFYPYGVCSLFVSKVGCATSWFCASAGGIFDGGVSFYRLVCSGALIASNIANALADAYRSETRFNWVRQVPIEGQPPGSWELKPFLVPSWKSTLPEDCLNCPDDKRPETGNPSAGGGSS